MKQTSYERQVYVTESTEPAHWRTPGISLMLRKVKHADRRWGYKQVEEYFGVAHRMAHNLEKLYNKKRN
jgi:hypothetical protein